MQNMGKRMASASLDPMGRDQKKQSGDVLSMGSIVSTAEPSAAAAAAAPRGGALESIGLDPCKGARLGQASSQAASTQLRGKSTTTELEEVTLLDYMLTLLLQCSARLRDLEAINNHTHEIPAQSNIYKVFGETYQGYLFTAPQNKNHSMGTNATGARRS